MNRRTIYGWTALTALGLLTGVARGDETVVRVSDTPPPNSAVPVPEASAPSVNGAVSGQCDGGTADGGAATGGGAVGIYRIGAGISGLLMYNPAAGFRPPTT